MNSINNYFIKISETLKLIDLNSLEIAINMLLKAYENDAHVYIFGNGGSGATASHVSGDFIKGVSLGLKKKFKLISLNDNMPAMMAIANDISFDDIFIEQLRGRLNPNDIVIGISGSGNSINVVKALEYANSQNIKTIALCGYKGGKIKDLASHYIHIPVMDMEITEDIHMIVFHAIKQELITRLLGNNTISMGEKYDKRTC
jgi:D-sedoheptulose 7-phosphate isomerase